MSHLEQFISKEDLFLLRNTKTKVVFSTLQAEKMILENQLAESEYRNLILSLRLKYGLEDNCSIDESTGKVLKPINEEKNNENS